jgi:hypothetical protein
MSWIFLIPRLHHTTDRPTKQQRHNITRFPNSENQKTQARENIRDTGRILISVQPKSSGISSSFFFFSPRHNHLLFFALNLKNNKMCTLVPFLKNYYYCYRLCSTVRNLVGQQSSPAVCQNLFFFFYFLTNVGRYKQKKERFRESLIQFMSKKFATVPHAAAANKSN